MKGFDSLVLGFLTEETDFLQAFCGGCRRADRCDLDADDVRCDRRGLLCSIQDILRRAGGEIEEEMTDWGCITE